ncbi:hypothetical protein [Shewanella colwelliana]|uniref:hypothetical protein n=1 Tax=Shewanella colwelliana TaxID=23 RepID=UPI0004BBA851|nr:hypothetical protein [Shewanella colwelliana]
MLKQSAKAGCFTFRPYNHYWLTFKFFGWENKRRVALVMNSELLPFEQQLKIETQKYLLKGVLWASWLSIFLACVVVLNDIVKPIRSVFSVKLSRWFSPFFFSPLYGWG